MRTLQFAAAVAAFMMLATSASAAELLVNGDFETGDLSGWTTYTTANGTIGAPTVSLFDTSGSEASQAARLQVGTSGFTGGGGLRQTFNSTGGSVTFLADVAVFAPNYQNLSGGDFSVLLDGVTLDTFGVGDIATGATIRGTLEFTADLAAGAHTLELLATRNYGGGGHTPLQFFDNVSLTDASIAVPEPATWGLMIAGFAGAGAMLRRRGAAQAPLAVG